MMEDVFDFLWAALQWIAVGLLLALFNNAKLGNRQIVPERNPIRRCGRNSQLLDAG